jgi:transcriptional regulator GlxA family with amidase domain
MRLLTRRVFADTAGAAAAVRRLSEALFIEAIGSCADQDPTLRRVVESIRDARIGRALNLMHWQIDQGWTLDRIAREVGMSRSRFAERFQALMGCTPMSYLCELRLEKARTLLVATRDPVQRVALSVGYRSPAAFSRAFASRYGRSPSDMRRTPA